MYPYGHHQYGGYNYYRQNQAGNSSSYNYGNYNYSSQGQAGSSSSGRSASSYYGNYSNPYQSSSSRSQEVNEVINHIRDKNFGSVLEGIKKMILPYLENTSFTTPSYEVSSTVDASASYNSDYNHIKINCDAMRAGAHSEDYYHKFFILTIGHELTHAWQNAYAPNAPNSHEEGHATWVESQLAKKIGAQDVFNRHLSTNKRHGGDEAYKYVTMYEHYKNIHDEGGVSKVCDSIKRAGLTSYSSSTSYQRGGSSDDQSSHSRDRSSMHHDHRKSSSWSRFWGKRR